MQTIMLSNTVRSGICGRTTMLSSSSFPFPKRACQVALYHTTRQTESSSVPLLVGGNTTQSYWGGEIRHKRQHNVPFRPLAGRQIIPDNDYYLRREFSSRRQRPSSKRSNDPSDSGVLANEKLIQAIVRQKRGISADEIQVRLVIDETAPQKATVTVVSLSEAIQISLDRTTDLIGMQLNNDPPVLRVTDLSKLEYQKTQKASKNTPKTGGSKTFRFRANIGDHDLNRKVADMIKFLEDGRDCDFSVFTKRATMRMNESAGMALVEKIQTLLADVGTMKRPPTKNEAGNNIQVKLEPIKRK